MKYFLTIALLLTAPAWANEHGHEHEHAENHAELTAEQSEAAGIATAVAKPAIIHQTITLTGRIMLNRDSTAAVRARFAGIVRQVKANWGDAVNAGQVLAVIEANESLRNYNVTAPFNGTVLERNTNIGDVAGDAPLFTIADLSNVWAELHVFPRNLGQLRKGQAIAIRSLDGKTAQAEVNLVLPTADAQSQTVLAIAVLPNESGEWKPGMAIEGDLLTGEVQAQVTVRADAIQRMEDKTVVFVQEGAAFEPREVTLGARDAQWVEIRAGLTAGERYVTEGSFLMKAELGKSSAAHAH
jgi:cobalt-zinc-cadmium efflux system membrane fusion protein